MHPLLWAYLIGYPFAVVVLREKIPKILGDEDDDDRFAAMMLAVLTATFWPLLAAVVIAARLYDSARRFILKNTEAENHE